MVLSKYLVAFLSILGTVAFAFQQAVADNVFDVQERWNLGALFVATIVAVLVPLLKGPWAAGLKVVGTVVIAMIGIVLGVLATGGEWTLNTWTAVIFAGINALLVQLGVSMRVETAKQSVVDATKSTAAIVAVDPAAVIASKESVVLEAPALDAPVVVSKPGTEGLAD